MGESAMSRLREQLMDQLARKVQAHGIVVWDDPAGEYHDAAASLVPEGARFEAFGGSWFQVRRRIEDAMSGEQPPALIVYGPGPPEDDPLAEVRAAGTDFTRRLSTLVRQAMAGQTTEDRINEISAKARTIIEAEAAIASNGDADVRLITALGSQDTTRILVAVLSGDRDSDIEAAGAWPAVADLCRQSVGAAVDGSGDTLRDSLFRHLLLCDISAATSADLPEALATAWNRPTAAQRDRAVDVLNRFLVSGHGAAVYRSLADRADAALSLGESLSWCPGLESIIGTAAAETIPFTHVIRALDAGDIDEAQTIAERRLATSPWATDPATGWGSRWRAVQATAHLLVEIAHSPVPRSAAGMLSWYAKTGWQVDRAHRRLELARTELGIFGELEETLTAARAAYDTWLDHLLTTFTAALEEEALDTGHLVRQGEVHDRFIGDGGARTAYVWVDALRFELGIDLAAALQPVAKDVSIQAAVAAAPTITPVGMANLLPGAAANLRVGLQGGRITVTVGGTEVNDVPARRNLLRSRHGTVADLDLNEAAQKGEKALSRAIGDAELVLLRSQEVDAAGESGMLSVAWSYFETVTNLLASVIARLAQAGVERVVICADHGFIALGQDLGSQRVVDPPAGATGTLKRRVFVGRGGVPNPATVRVPLAACGVASDLDIVVPRGLAVFRAGGGRQFFHGGLSPQELIVPLIVLDVAQAPQPQKLAVRMRIAGDRITTGVFAATLVSGSISW
jgi:PglZ domain